MAETRERILAAAEQLFGEQGFAATSLRAVTSAAGVNLAAVNYHFRSKEALFEEVARRCMQPLATERLRRLDALKSSGQVPTLEALLDAYLTPMFDEFAHADDQGSSLMRFFVQVLSDPNPLIQELVFASARETATQYLAAFAQALPHLSPQELIWRFRTMNIVVFQSASGVESAGSSEQTLPTANAVGSVNRAWMMTFLSSALAAPATSTTAPNSEG